MARRDRRHLGRGHFIQDRLAAGGSSRGVREAGDGAAGGGGGDPGATGHDLRPDRPAVGDERADGVGFDRPAAGARPGSGFGTAGAGAAPGPYGTVRQDEVGARQPPRVSVGEAQHRLRGSAEPAQSAPGVDSHPRREPTALPQGDAGGARSGVGGFRRERQRGNRAGAGWGTARPAWGGADADGREAARHRFPAGIGDETGHADHAHHRRAAAIRGGARDSGGGGSAPRAKRERGGDEPVQRRDTGDGELSHVRSEPGSATRGGQGPAAEPRDFGAV